MRAAGPCPDSTGMLSLLRKILRNERGATAVEYSVMVVGIAAVIVLSVSFLGKTTSSNFDCSGKSIQNKTTACTAGVSSNGTPTSSPTPTPTPSPTSGNGGGNNGGNNGNGGVGQGNGQGNSNH